MPILSLLFLLVLVVLVGCSQTTTSTTELTTSLSSSSSTTMPSSTTIAPTTTTTQTMTTTLTTTTTQLTTSLPRTIDLLSLQPYGQLPNNPSSTEVYYQQSFQDGQLQIIPQKSHKLDALTLDVSSLDLSMMKKLVITVKGDGMMLLKVHSTKFIEPGRDEIRVPLSMFETTFEFNLDFQNYDLVRDTMKSITLVFGIDVIENKPTQTFDSPITITAFYFSDEAANSNRTFNTRGVVTDPDDLINLPIIDLMEGWMINEADTYIISQVTEGLRIQTTLSKPVWGFIYIPLEGYLKPYTVISITVSGTPGAAFKMKLEGPGITTIETGSSANGNIPDPILSASAQTFTWTVTQANMTAGEAIRLLIFFEPGLAGTGAQMTITKFELKTPVA